MIFLSFLEFDACMDVMNMLLAKLSTLPEILNESSSTYVCNMAFRDVFENEDIINTGLRVHIEDIVIRYGWDKTTMQFGSCINNAKIKEDIENLMDLIESAPM